MASTSAVYISVIEDVINKVKEEFANGAGEDVLKELQGTWEAKMMQAGVVNAPIERSAAAKPTPGVTPVHDLNVPYEGTEEYETPTADLLFPPTPAPTPIPQTPLQPQTPGQTPGTAETYNIPTGASDDSAGGNAGANTDLKPGRPSPYMQPPSPWMTQRPPLDVNIAYVEGRDEVDRGASHQPPTQDFFTMSAGKRKREEIPPQYQAGGFIPQQDGAADAIPEFFEIEICGGSTSIGRAYGKMSACTPKIPQLDGPIPDPYEELSTPNIYNYQGAFNEDYNIANTPAPNDVPVTPAPVVNDVGDDDEDDEPPLNENDDDDQDDVDQGEELNTQHLVLAQFDKVTRTKSRWKCTLKDGIMHINNKDVLFNKATGEFDF
ncbi:PREDICTED: transcription initiation factor IIA large subunit-like [Fragaria vesca subsp. vesca]|uniref:transcription initiation factor IIA large subunit-like n=1 Tax=Fragaria vesca subsp. vesca TaxID=101020 RepID=UPI0002C30579|nr:PREDICTED: transcription initiation factor IIA large subunit-like [Fragaria vesca subsp. vesca]